MNNCIAFLVQYPEYLALAESIDPSSAIFQIGDQLAVVLYCGDRSYEAEGDNLPYSAVPKCFGLTDTKHLTEMGILQVENLPGFDLYGQGVLLGIVDTGINYREEIFRSRDGSSRVLSVWDQTAGEEGESEEMLPYVPFGRAYGRAELTAGTADTGDDIGHGTYLASVAAGNASGAYRGVAPECQIAAVRLRQASEELKRYWRIGTDAPCYSEADILLGIQYLVQLAEINGLPLVLLLALGTNNGSHTGEGLFNEYLDRLSRGRGRAVVIAAGNEANAAHHYQSRPLELREDDAPEEVQFTVNGARQMTAELWGRVGELYSVDLLSPGGNRLGRIPPVSEGSLTRNFLLEGTTVTVGYQAVERRSGEEVILLKFDGLTDGIWTIYVYPERLLSFASRFHIWLPIRQFLQGEAYFLRPEPDITVTEPGNANQALTFGAYDDLTEGILPESGRGFTRTNYVKPDLVAPGALIPGITGLPELREPVDEAGYVLRTGTSSAAAGAAGAVVLLMEWGIVRGHRPFLSGTQIKALLINGARRESGRAFPNRQWGYGELDLYGALSEIR